VAITVEEAAEVDTVAEAIPLTIVHEDDDLIVINKPAGMVVHPAPGSPSGTLVNALSASLRRRPVWDRGGEASGHRPPDRQGHVRPFGRGEIRSRPSRVGRAVCRSLHHSGVSGAVPRRAGGGRSKAARRARCARGLGRGGAVSTQLARHKTDRQRQAVLFDGGRHAVTHLRVEESFAGAVLRACLLPVGDGADASDPGAYVPYRSCAGGRSGIWRAATRVGENAGPVALEVNGFSRQALHAATLGFLHPVSGEDLQFSAPMPEDMAHMLAGLREAAR
jgi:23S rRNA pseudouridine1911/1915/1917 synthase